MSLAAVVVGCGFIGGSDIVQESGIQSHAAAWSVHPGTRLTGLCDPDPARLAAAAERWGPTVASADLDRVLSDCRPDIVSVATPDATHAAVLERVLGHPGVRGVLVEKPLALDRATGQRLALLAQRRGIVVAVNYSRRYAPSHRALARWLEGRPIGTLEAIRGYYVGGLKHNGTHWIDLARWLVGELTSVRGIGVVPRGAADATIDLAFEFAGSGRGSLTGLSGASYSLFEMDLIGATGRVTIAESGQRFVTTQAAPSRRFPGFRELAPMPGPQGGLADLLLHAANDLVEALATDRQPLGTIADALAALSIAEDAIVSAGMGSQSCRSQ